MQLVATSPADGYTLLYVNSITHGTMPAMSKSLAFDPVKDFAPIAPLFWYANVFLCNPSVTAKNIQELITFAKQNPDKLTNATAGPGSGHDFIGSFFNSMTGVKILHVHYKGGGPAAADVVAGHIPLAFASASSVTQFLEAGRLIPIGVPSAKRSVVFPEVPTFTEAGVQGVELNSWVGVLAPAHTPEVIVKQLNIEINAVLAEPEVKAQLQGYGIIAASGSAGDFANEIKRDFDLYGPVTKQAGIKAN